MRIDRPDTQASGGRLARVDRGTAQGRTPTQRIGRVLTCVVAGTALLVTGCTAAHTSGSQSPAADNTSGTQSEAAHGNQSAAPNGITAQQLTVQSTLPTSLNPALGPIGENATLYIYPAYGALIYQRQDGTFVPDLATKWGYVGSGNKQFTLTLRPGLKFSDGTPLNAKAVVNSLKFFRDSHGPQAQLLANLTDAKAGGDLDVTLTFSKPTPDIPYLLSQSQNVGAIVGPKGIANPKSLESQSDGAGPYTLSSSGIIANNQYTYVANPTYWNKAAVHYRQLVIKDIDDPNTILSALKTGQIDAALKNVSASSDSGATSAGMTLIHSPYAMFGLILADRGGTISPLGNLKVRQAINYALDRKSLATLVGGQSATPTNQIAAPGAPGYSKAAAGEYAHDIAKAKSLLAAAGYPHGFTLPVLDAANNDPNSIVGQGVASDLAAIGVNVKLTVAPSSAQFIPDAMAKKYPALLFPVPFEGKGFYYAAGLALSGFWNPFNSSDSGLTSLQARAAAATSDAAQESAFEQISSRVTQLAWFAPIAMQNYSFIVSKKIAGVQDIDLAAAGLMNPVGPAADLSWYQTAG